MANSFRRAAIGLVAFLGLASCGSGPSKSETGSPDGAASLGGKSDAPDSQPDQVLPPDAFSSSNPSLVDAYDPALAADRPQGLMADAAAATPAEAGAGRLDVDSAAPLAFDGATGDRPSDAFRSDEDSASARDRVGSASEVHADRDAGSGSPDPWSPASCWVSLSAPLGTPITAIAIDSDGVLFAGSENEYIVGPSSGIFVSPDEGVSWHSVNTGVHDFHVTSLFADGTTLYAGTASLLRSMDHGASWIELTNPTSVGHINAIGAQGNLIMAGSDYGGNPLALSQDGGETFKSRSLSSPDDTNDIAVLGSVILWASSGGLLRSTDGGTTFGPIPGINNGMDFGATIKCDGVQTCYAGVHLGTQSEGGVVAKSTDAGATWTSTGKASSTVLALSDSGSVYVSTYPTMARSDDGGATWSSIYRPTTVDAFAPDCDGPFVARGDKVFAACPDGVYRSTDQGAHWNPASGSAATGAITGTVWMMVIDTTPTALGADGDIYLASIGSALQRSIDGGQTWQVVSDPYPGRLCIVTGNGALECAAYTASSTTPGLQRSEDHGVTWKEIPSVKETVQAIANLGSVVYVATTSHLLRSDDDGLTYQALSGSPKVTSLQVLKNGHVLAGTISDETYRSTDQGATWKPSARSFSLPILDDGKGRLFIGDNNGNVEVSTDEGDSWQFVENSGLPYASQSAGPLGMDGAGRLFFNDWGPGDSPYYSRGLLLYVSTDDGATWKPSPVQPPNPNISIMATDKRGRLVVATSSGVYRLE